jgi:hypothetical protein
MKWLSPSKFFHIHLLGWALKLLCPFALYYVPNRFMPNFEISRIFCRERGIITINVPLFKKQRDIGSFMYQSAVVYCCCVLLFVVGCSFVLLCVVAFYRGLLVAVCEQVLRGGGGGWLQGHPPPPPHTKV